MKYRTNLGISGDIFSVLKESGTKGLNATALLQKANLHYTKMTKIMKTLVEAGLVEERAEASSRIYILTPKGLQYTEKLEEFQEFTAAFGLGL